MLDENGTVVGIVSAGDLMSLEARNPFALRHSMQWARDESELASAASEMPKLLVDLLDARLDASVICRVLTVLHDTLTARLLELAFARHGAPPVDYAWLVFGSAARNEFTLASDQDNGLAYSDTDDPDVHEYFRCVAEAVNNGLARCGIEADPHGVLASGEIWHRTLTSWKRIFSAFLEGDDVKLVLNASVCFDYRQAAGQLYVTQALTDLMREAPAHPHFMQCLARLGSGFRRRCRGFGRSSIASSTSSRAVSSRSRTSPAITPWRAGSRSRRRWIAWPPSARSMRRAPSVDRTLREAYLTLKQLQLEHHADAVREGRKPDNVIDTDALRPLTRANLQEALRVVTAAQSRFPRLAAGLRSL